MLSLFSLCGFCHELETDFTQLYGLIIAVLVPVILELFQFSLLIGKKTLLVMRETVSNKLMGLLI